MGAFGGELERKEQGPTDGKQDTETANAQIHTHTA